MYEPAINDLLAGVIDLAPADTAPHAPGPCPDLCTPACTGSDEVPAAPTSAEEIAAGH